MKAFSAELSTFDAFELDTWVGAPADGDPSSFTVALGVRMKECDDGVDDLSPPFWSLYLARRREVQELGLEEFARLLEGRNIPSGDLGTAYAYCTYATIVREVLRFSPQLGRFSGLKHHQIRDEFQRLEIPGVERRPASSAGHKIAAASETGCSPPITKPY